MENYNEEINTGTEERPRLKPRLIINRAGNGYGYNLYDRKLKTNLLVRCSKETCESAILLLVDNDIDKFNTLKDCTEGEVIETGQILMWHGKHSVEYYNINTLPDLYKVSLHLLKVFFEIGYIQKWDLTGKELDYTKDDILNMPESIQEDMIKKLRLNERDIASYKENNDIFDKATKCIETNDGQTAFRVLMNRCDNEYERIEIIKPHIIK